MGRATLRVSIAFTNKAGSAGVISLYTISRAVTGRDESRLKNEGPHALEVWGASR